MLTHSEENYLKAIYHLSLIEDNGVSTNAIAQKMNTKASSVTDMIKKLSEKGFMNYQKYQGVSLTKEGKMTAKMVIRKHRLWEVFLVEKLDFSWDEVHIVAEELEHIKSEKLINKLDAFLGFPKEDPHGDPIPNAKGEVFISEKFLLNEMDANQICICVGVKDTSSEFLQYLDRQNIALGKTIIIKSKESFDNSMVIEVNNVELMISNKIANNILVKKQ
ncbi:metal-dependent transcriptional regulator [Paenimyroides tangerinum]|uniref:Transcriptional regulator MntR n=1 Tax=Paenimyroides tangerinum TaxID=2488728 RepID=A0A3P3WAS4_9FLAO|nr:metal-dependent transcriptional regulator [Paenimyroides tangerinum]RRJ92265.1 metal-dependent transcriptional regulator [Paenimyroides tangerinum]